MIAGLLANGLGYQRTNFGLLQRLQDRLVLAARWDRPAKGFAIFRPPNLTPPIVAGRHAAVREGRAGGAGTYAGKHNGTAGTKPMHLSQSR